MPNKQSEKPFVQPGESLNDFLRSFWQRQIDSAENEIIDYKHPVLPLARIKKVMKTDPDVKMISADVPILLCKACETDLNSPLYPYTSQKSLHTQITSRTFIISDSNKRRTLSRSDITAAVSKSDRFDFLLDIVPRDIGGMRKREIGDGSNQGVGGGAGPSGFNGGAAGGGNSGVGNASGSGQVGQAKTEGLEGLQTFDEEGRNVDGRRMVNRSGDVLEELELLLEKLRRRCWFIRRR
ncbi:histone-fold-containing protein [Dendrothele bispora CBS 962.96]|uniref:Histone-fold-containing protein n=1 Tax=Dendrothele bispora (strain CBS 962.96) TaxID=1314807 RepID=A0A4S8MGP8_DENBC|nr:histone-fold-containing protein [Dendrothele bispora CBS 962.96]